MIKFKIAKEALDIISNTKNCYIQERKKKNIPTSIFNSIENFAKDVGPIPFTSATLGFCCLPVGGTTIGLVTGIAVKKFIKLVAKKFARIK